MNPYYYLYYRIYKSVSKTNKVIPEWSAAIAQSLLIFFNLGTIGLYLKIQGLYENLEKGIFVLSLTTIMCFNLYLFLRNDFYKRVIKKYENTRSFWGTLFVLAYVILTIFLFVWPFYAYPLRIE